MKTAKKSRNARKVKPSPHILAARGLNFRDLCTSLVAIAGLHVEDEAAQMKIYEAVRRLQMLEKAAIDAGLTPSTGSNLSED